MDSEEYKDGMKGIRKSVSIITMGHPMDGNCWCEIYLVMIG